MTPRWEGILGWLMMLAGLALAFWAALELDNAAPVAGLLLTMAGAGHALDLSRRLADPKGEQ